MMQIHFLRHIQIDKQRWDSVVDSSIDGSVYAYSWYLDSMAEHWDALVTDNYEFIMPVPWKKKFGIRYVCMPFFIQQLGIFSAKPVPENILNSFLDILKKKFPYIEYSLKLNNEKLLPYNFQLLKRTNFVLDISQSYGEISANYSKDAKRSLRNNEGITFEYDSDIKSIIANYLGCYGEMNRLNKTVYLKLNELSGKGLKNNCLIGLSVIKAEAKLASALFFINQHSAYYVLGAPTREGKKQNGTHFLIDFFIREFSGKLRQLDFEGSDIPSVAYFYKKWGSTNIPYYHVTYNRLPFINKLRWIRSRFFR